MIRSFRWRVVLGIAAVLAVALVTPALIPSGYLKEAGVMLVVGSDAGNWPLFPYYFHGPTTWRELRLLAEAGLTPQEILRAATVSAAKMLGLDDRIGTVEVGKVADLLVVRDDPLVDLERSLRSLQHTIRGGVARTPAAWMASH